MKLHSRMHLPRNVVCEYTFVEQTSQRVSKIESYESEIDHSVFPRKKPDDRVILSEIVIQACNRPQTVSRPLARLFSSLCFPHSPPLPPVPTSSSKLPTKYFGFQCCAINPKSEAQYPKLRHTFLSRRPQ